MKLLLSISILHYAASLNFPHQLCNHKNVKALRPLLHRRIFSSLDVKCQIPSHHAELIPSAHKTKLWQPRKYAMAALACLLCMKKKTIAMAIPVEKATSAVSTATAAPGLPLVLSFIVLFSASAGLHAAEIAITTLYPWKVREFAEEEGPKSPFKFLQDDITRVLTTILVLTTCCTVTSTVLFTQIASCFSLNVAKATTILTLITIFFGELIPKALGVSNAEVVARSLVPPLAVLCTVFSPFALAFSWLAKSVLKIFGFNTQDTGFVSEEELRLLVMGAKESGGIETEEAKMVEGVLDLQDTKVSEVMRHRVDVEALEANATLSDLLVLLNETKYSRIPVYDGEVDKICGVVIAKDMLKYVGNPDSLDGHTVSEIMEPTYFVPETMVVQRVLEEMRKRRLHMAIVVDEYGGTAGIVTLEDILEEVVGEIYDEGDIFEEEEMEDNIMPLDDGSFELRGIAELESVCLALNISCKNNEEDMSHMILDDSIFKEFNTLSGFLSAQAGEIPSVGDCILVNNYIFTVTEGDERRILLVHAQLNLDDDERKGGFGMIQDEASVSGSV